MGEELSEVYTNALMCSDRIGAVGERGWIGQPGSGSAVFIGVGLHIARPLIAGEEDGSVNRTEGAVLNHLAIRAGLGVKPYGTSLANPHE